MTAGPQATFIVEYPCDQFCHIEVELAGESQQTTLQQMWEKAERQHRRVHEPDLPEAEAPVADQGQPRRPAATVFRAAPGRGVDRRR